MYKHSSCGFCASEKEWNSYKVYIWALIPTKPIQFFRCPTCKSDIAFQSLEKN